MASIRVRTRARRRDERHGRDAHPPRRQHLRTVRGVRGTPATRVQHRPGRVAARLGDYHPVALAVAGDATANLALATRQRSASLFIGRVGFQNGAARGGDDGANDLIARRAPSRTDRAGREDATCLAEERADALLRAAPRVAAGVASRRASRCCLRAASKPSSKIVALGGLPAAR